MFILGKDWGNHIDGQKLKAVAESLQMELTSDKIISQCREKVEKVQLTGHIFAIESTRSRSGRGNELLLKANFSPDLISAIKEV